MSSVPDISSPRDLAGERVVERIAGLFARALRKRTVSPSILPITSRDDEIALMRPVDVAALLRQVQRVRRRDAAYWIFTTHVPVRSAAGAAGGGVGGCAGGFESSAWTLSAMIFESPSAIMYGVTEMPVRPGLSPPRAGTSVMRGSPSSSAARPARR